MWLKIRNKLQFIQDIALLPWVIIRLFINPNNIEPIFSLGTFRNHKAFQLAKEKIHSDPGMAAMMNERYLAKEMIDLNALAKLPDGTLGREFARFMLERNLKVDFYPPYNDPNNDDAAYVRKRCPQTHDIWHLVIGVGTEQLGEMKVSAFYVAQIRSPFNALFIGIGLFVALFKKPEMLEKYFEAVSEGWALGKAAKPLFAMKWEYLWDRPLVEIRRELNLPENPSGVASIPLVSSPIPEAV
jgi:ubiquinone biosynthesis protein COQ4